MARQLMVSAAFAFYDTTITVTKLSLTCKGHLQDTTTWGAAHTAAAIGLKEWSGTFEGIIEGVPVAPGTTKATLTLVFTGFTWTWTNDVMSVDYRVTGNAETGEVTVAGAFRTDGDKD